MFLRKTCFLLSFFLNLFIFDLSFASTIKIKEYIWGSNSIQYQNQRLYVVFENTVDKDYLGTAIVYCGVGTNRQKYGTDQVISIFAKNVDGVFYDDNVWFGGDVKCDADTIDSKGVKQDVGEFVINADLDTDKDGVGNNKDEDDDGDGLSDLEEKRLGTDSLSGDTDKDGFPDKTDLFPLDKGDWYDNDNDGVGDNKDTDDDNDGVTDVDEARLGGDRKKADTDGDGLSDLEEKNFGTKLNSTDTDGDGLTDFEEVQKKLNPLNIDTDNDGVNDKQDLFPLDPYNNTDSDKDGVGDGTDEDDDNDGLIDSDEEKYSTDKNNIDTDNDGLTDLKEVQMGTDPNKKDTDGDGVTDDLDAFPLDYRYSKDDDGDGIPNDLDNQNNFTNQTGNNPIWVFPIASGTIIVLNKDNATSTAASSLLEFNKNYDNLINFNNNTIPDAKNKDADEDGLSDFVESFLHKTNSEKKDTDNDGLEDGEEVRLGSNPLLKDTDSDFVLDKEDEFPLDKTNGAGDDDEDGIITKVEVKYWLNYKDKTTYFIPDIFSYYIIKYWYIWLFIMATIIYIIVKRKNKNLKIDRDNIRQRQEKILQTVRDKNMRRI